MRKPFSVLAAAAIALSIVAGGCAKEKAPSPPEPAKKAAAGNEKKAAPKPRGKFFTGTIEALDASAGTLTLKGPKGARGFQAREKVKEQLDGLKIGDKVIVKHIDGIALSIMKSRTSKDALVRKEKEGAVKEVGPVCQADPK